MKKVMAIVAALTLLLTMAVAMPASAALSDQLGESVVTNGDFANGVTDWGTAGETVIVHSKEVAAGEPADSYIQLTPKIAINQETGLPGYVSGAGSLTQDVAVVPGEFYVFEVTYKATTNNSAWFVTCDTGWTTIKDAMLPATGETLETAEWGTYTMMVRIPEGIEVLKVYPRCHPWNGVYGTITDEGCYYDEIKMQKVEGVDPENLISNAGFEFDANGETENIYGWEQAGTDKNYKAWQTKGDPSGEPYCPPTEENGLNVAYADTSAGNAVLKQTVTVDSKAPYYSDWKNYTWNLSFDAYSGVAGGSDPSVTVTMANASGGTSSKTWVLGTDLAWANNIAAKMYRNTVNLDTLVEELEAPPQTITVELATKKEAAWDNIVLKPTYQEAEDDETAFNYVEGLNPSFENLTNGVLDNWKFVGTITDEALGTNGGSKGDNYIGLLDMTYAQLDISSEQLPAGSMYKLLVDYKQMGTDGFIKIEDGATGATIAEIAMGQETGTSEEELKWKRFELDFILTKHNTSGIRVLLRNGTDANMCYYDNLRIRAVDGYDPDALVLNGTFELSALVGSTNIVGWSHVDGRFLSTIGIQDNKTCAYLVPSATLSQKVTINDYNTAKGENYGFSLNWDLGYFKGGAPSFRVIVGFEDGTTVERNVNVIRDGEWAVQEDESIKVIAFNSNRDPIPSGEFDENGKSIPLWREYDPKTDYIAKLWAWNNGLTYDMSHLTQSSTSPVTYIELQFFAGTAGAHIDNVDIKINKPNVSISDANGGNVIRIADCENAAFTAKGTYYGEAADAALFFAVYNVLEDDTLELVDVKMVSGVENAATEALTIDNLTLQSGKQIMSVIMLEKGSLKPIAAKIIK